MNSIAREPGTVSAARGFARAWRRVVERGVEVALVLCGLLSIFTTFAIIAILLEETRRFFTMPDVSFGEFFGTMRWAPLLGNDKHFGIWPLIAGTALVSGVAALLALPLGLITAIFLSEYASPRLRNVLKPALEILAGIPTVVYGYFALTAVTPLLRQLGVQVDIFNVLAGGLVMGVMLIPTVASLSEDAMAAVPRALRDGAYGLGADRFQVATRVVVPAALSGIIASFVLAISRAVGETMIVLIAVGQLPQLTLDPRVTVETLTAFIGATGNGDVPTGSIEYKTIFAVGLTLFVLTFLMNVLSIRLVRRFREVYD